MRPLDWVVIAVYLAIVVGLGIWMGRGERNLEGYFLGGHGIPWWAALMSLIATEISAATFLGAPEQGYTRDLTYLQFGIGTIVARIVLAGVFIDAFYRFKVYTVYGFLLQRFGLATNSTTAGLFLLGRLFADGSRLFIASLAIHVATGLAVPVSVAVLAGAAVAYTLVGGIKGVIWTEVLQAGVLLGGALVLIGSLLAHIPLAPHAVFETLWHAGKFHLIETAALTATGETAMWVNPYHVLPAVLGGFFLTMATHGTDHDMVQRLLTCRESADGKRSLWMSGFLGIGLTCLFLLIGQLLFVYVGQLADADPMRSIARELASAGKNNLLLLHYIVRMLPAGVTGLVLAAVIAAATSSLGSALNASSATAVTDFYQRYFKKEASSAHYVGVSRWMTLVIGLLDVGVALGVWRYAETHPGTDLLSIALGVMTFFYGGMLGIFLVGLGSRTRGNGWSNVLGAALGIATVVALKFQSNLAWPWFIVIGTAITVAVALLGRTALDVSEAFAASDAESRLPTSPPQG